MVEELKSELVPPMFFTHCRFTWAFTVAEVINSEPPTNTLFRRLLNVLFFAACGLPFVLLIDLYVLKMYLVFLFDRYQMKGL
ncbi:hypothetical protein D3C80_1696570 [compost metagenome]